MNKWNEEAAPNNNLKASDMDSSYSGSPKPAGKMSEEQLNDRKIENEIRKQNF